MASATEKAQVAAPLRVVAIATFLPAFALCVAHGARSGRPVPVVGLVPLAFSSGLSIFLLVRQRRYNKKNKSKKKQAQPRNPVLTFFADVVLAAALMVVLVFTWIQTGGSAELAMLAAYATIPLLINFFIHLYLAVREFSRGLAIPALIQYLAWQVVPGACPDCGRHLRPESTPAMPWFASTSSPSNPNPSAPPNSFFRSFKMPSSMKAWKKTSSSSDGGRAAFLPPWFPGQQHRYAALEGEDGNENVPHHNGAADRGGDDVIEEPVPAAAAPYRDDPEAAGEPSTPATDLLEEPEEVEVVSKKKKRSQGSLDQGSSRVWSDS
ncbi:hypothetical protein PG994_008126 [Apiospora phragmitis]|uniref:Uncharacterized protein n=1 Tax=Apiospora phragmitis TaxID=2905665 RepID=A0ABR1UUM8_9PEZI